MHRPVRRVGVQYFRRTIILLSVSDFSPPLIKYGQCRLWDDRISPGMVGR